MKTRRLACQASCLHSQCRDREQAWWPTIPTGVLLVPLPQHALVKRRNDLLTPAARSNLCPGVQSQVLSVRTNKNLTDLKSETIAFLPTKTKPPNPPAPCWLTASWRQVTPTGVGPSQQLS